ncbi:AfsR/SARP family transcriptional regulator [Streptomyces noursei]|uniref:AfsR/SARP family transcriptional regulator n=1 Tax=Streptomyces noursei TaxID=1971 RepID=UPI00167ADD09|nr:AfsR/SARP family transcriptional regulator [Streptomyces noursei]MCZ1018712.1 AfsR/SARP family transcriptional regulator [Streptomyces noursei]
MLISLDGAAGYIDLAPKPRTVLTVLLVNAGVVVPVSSLVREVWADSPPASALRNIQTYILQSRTLLLQVSGASKRAVARDLLVTRPGGYLFGAESAQFDHLTYRKLVDAGRGAIRQGDCMKGTSLLDRALEMWRGPAIVDVMTGVMLDAWRHQLEGSKLGVIEDLCSAKIAMGRYHEAAADLAVSVWENPLHEGLHYQYMRALSMSGDRAHALDVFNRLRMNLVAELGIDPSDSIQELQRSILHSSSAGYTAPYPPSMGRMTPVV